VDQVRVNGPAGRSEARGFDWRDWVDPRRVGWIRMLLVFVPATAIAQFAHAPSIVKFILAGLGIVPLAGLIGEATEALACRVGPGIGGLLNATFGNAAELIIALFALSKGLDDVVKASLTGSVVGNLLLVLGASLLAGGIRHPVQRFNRTVASSASTLMVLAAVGLVIPGGFHELVGKNEASAEHGLSLSVSVVLIFAYGLNLLFSLKTHKGLYEGGGDGQDSCDLATGDPHDPEGWGVRTSTIVLLVSTAFVAWMSEVLVGEVEEASRALGLTEVFVGVIIVAIVGNAAEHSTAVYMAWKNQNDLAVGIAMGSALQIALFVAPVLVFLSYLRAEPLDLEFSAMEVAALILAVMLARMVTEDGESNWLEGAMLLMIYAIIGLAFFFLPTSSRQGQSKPPAPTKAQAFRHAEPLDRFGRVSG
jgi:Ca2+:H+ antiporter